MNHARPEKDLVLVGGGHSHAIVLKKWGMQPLEDVRLTLVSNVSLTPYSGMIPGYIHGDYSYEEMHIDLRRLAEFAGARFILAPVEGLDLENRRVLFENRPPLDFDILSLNIGSKPAHTGVPGADRFAIPVKPVPEFLTIWDEIRQATDSGLKKLLVVGGGVASVEVALSMKKRLGDKAEVSLISRDDPLLKTHDSKVSTLCTRLCEQNGIRLQLGVPVSEVKEGRVCLESGPDIEGDHIFWLTHAGAPAWLKKTRLLLDRAGFILVGETLQSISHDFVFAAGDIATIEDQPRPKSGVYAVRQAKPLLANLRAYAKGQHLIQYRPQKRALALIGVSSVSAIASKGRLAAEAPRIWKLKDFIDRKFMQQFDQLPSMHDDFEPLASAADRDMRCLGCAAKIGSPVLRRAFERVNLPRLDDDAALIDVPAGKRLVQSKDFFPALINDPYLLGKLIVQHGFSDIFAMGAQPHSALALLLVPEAAGHIIENDLVQCLSGIVDALKAIGAELIGGHTAEGSVLSVGLTCNGLADPDRILTKKGLRKGDALILTKPLGTGALFAAHMRRQARGAWLDAAIDSMLQSNQAAAEVFLEHGATACTDVTGFGLIGHLVEMLDGEGVQIHLDAVPALPGALSIIGQGLLSTLDPENRKAEERINTVASSDLERYDLLFDPQTSGGLLAGVPENRASDCLAQLHAAGYTSASIMGNVTQPENASRPITIDGKEST
ncbi:MAG: selenide, water dikinase SelD [Verrucomicrobiota bacterium]